MMRSTFEGAKNSGAGSVSAITLTNPSIASRFAPHGPEELLHLRRRRFQRREVACELEQRKSVLVAGPLVPSR
jgi:hypothetical protein